MFQVKARPVILTLLVSAVFLSVFAIAGPARTEATNCPQVPSVKWWGKTNHQKITNYVTRKHDGDWMPYIKKWNRQLAKMKVIYDRGGSAVFKKKGITIEDEQLLHYIKAIEMRLSATRCLALREFERAAEELREMETASGEDEPAPKSN